MCRHMTTVFPFPKVAGIDLCREFREINTIDAYEKVLELIVKKQIHEHCDRNSIIEKN